MSRPLRPATPDDVARIKLAQGHLREALSLLRQSGAPRTTARVAAALASCGGAVRHAEGRLIRSRAP